MILPTRFPFIRTAIVLGLLSLGSFLGAGKLTSRLEQSPTCPMSGMAAAEGKSTTLSGPFNSINAPTCGCCTSNSLASAGATGIGIVTLQILGTLSGLSALSMAGVSLVCSSRRPSADVQLS